jgi:transcriptional regulator with XRE-family HTH domain
MNGRALVAWNLRRIRVTQGVSQERLAFDAGIDRAYVGGIERQSENPTVDVLDKLATSLGVPIESFFRVPLPGEEEPPPLKAGRHPIRKE